MDPQTPIMNHVKQSDRTVQETLTSLPAADVLQEAKRFFSRRPNIYAAFVEQESPAHITLRGQGGEEIVIAVISGDKGTRVTGSTYLFDQQISRFFTQLPAPSDTSAIGAVTP
jgi:hypothetical protein